MQCLHTPSSACFLRSLHRTTTLTIKQWSWLRPRELTRQIRPSAPGDVHPYNTALQSSGSEASSLTIAIPPAITLPQCEYSLLVLHSLTEILTCTSVRLRGRPYTHMPMLRVASALDESASARATHADATLASSPADFGLLVEQSSQKREIPCLGRRWTAVQNLTPLALSSAETCVTVQTAKQNYKQ